MIKYHYHCVDIGFGNERWRVFWEGEEEEAGEGNAYYPIATCESEFDAARITEAMNEFREKKRHEN